MKKGLRLFIGLICLLSFQHLGFAQCIPNFYIHRPQAECLGDQGMKIHFTQEQYVTHDIYRREVGDTSWGAPLYAGYYGVPTQSGIYLNLMTNFYLAPDHLPGQTYEYRITRTFDNVGSFSGYVLAGCEIPATVNRGNAIILVSAQLSDSLESELQTMRMDLIADGYKVYMLEADESSTPPAVKAQIQQLYNSIEGEKTYLFIVGHVPVPYSGHMMSDDQIAHRGAWPADVYYGDLNGVYTDYIANTTEAVRPENHNVPGDGKFDQHLIQAKPVIAVGRADFSRLSCFAGKTEAQITKRYLAKDHAFRSGLVNHNGNALMCDNMEFYYGNNPQVDGFIEYYAKIGDNNFRALTGDIIPNYVWFPNVRDSLSMKSHHFSYISGTSSYTNINNIATAGQINAMSGVNSVFNWSFGAYFGDWDNSCNFMRMFIGAPGTSLTQIWAGNPSSYFHMFGLDRTIGETLLEHQWNFNYNHHNLPNPNADNYYRRVHISLMGDPTLRMEYEKPVNNVNVVTGTSAGTALISWESNGTPQTRYLVFRAANLDQPFEQIGETAINQVSYIDYNPLPGNSIYMVRAKALRTTGSGSYYNLSSGRFANFTNNALNFSAALASNVVCKPQNQIAVNYSMSNNLINASATVLCYVNSPSDPLYQQNITLNNTGQVLLNLPDVANGSWVKYRTTVIGSVVPPSLDSVRVFELPVCEINYEIVNGEILLSSDSSASETISWTLNGESLGNTAQVIAPIESPVINIELSRTNPCGTASTSLDISITDISVASASGISIRPNPANDQVNLSAGFAFDGYQICDITGRVLISAYNQPSSTAQNIEVSNLSSGIYFCTVFSQGKSFTQRMTIAH